MRKVFFTMLNSVALQGEYLSIRSLVLGSSVYLKGPPKNPAFSCIPPRDSFLLLPLRPFQEQEELSTWLGGSESARPVCPILFLGNRLPL